MRLVILFATCACACAQTGVYRPQLGKMLDRNGAVRAVYGIAASVTLGDEEITGVLSSGCSHAFCLVKTETSIISAAGFVDAPPGPALFAFDGAAAYLWFPRSRQLARWHDGLLDSIDANIEGDVLSIGVNAGAVQFAVRRLKHNVWIVNLDGSLAGSVPRSIGPVMLISSGELVHVERGEIVIRNLRLPLEGVTAMAQMSTSYLQVRAAGVDYSLRIDPGRETLFQLPGVPQ